LRKRFAVQGATKRDWGDQIAIEAAEAALEALKAGAETCGPPEHEQSVI